MNDFISNLYSHVTEDTRIPVSETACKASRMDKIHDELTSRLNDDEIKLLDKFTELSDSVHCDLECRAFANGIKTAVQISPARCPTTDFSCSCF